MHRQSEPRAGNQQRHTRTRNVSLPTQANHTARGARKQPPNRGAIHAASEDTTCPILLCNRKRQRSRSLRRQSDFLALVISRNIILAHQRHTSSMSTQRQPKPRLCAHRSPPLLHVCYSNRLCGGLGSDGRLVCTILLLAHYSSSSSLDAGSESDADSELLTTPSLAFTHAAPSSDSLSSSSWLS